jgi:anti-sigma factor RsiW
VATRRTIMDIETLERLLIDRAAGELPPDTTALLDAFLEKEPELAALALRTDETIRLAKQVLDAPRPVRLPPLKTAALLRGRERTSVARRWRNDWAYGMAACFAAGLVAGLLVLREMTLPVARPPARNGGTVAQATPVESEFWSVQNLRSQNRNASPGVHSQLIWDSPVRKPEITHPS